MVNRRGMSSKVVALPSPLPRVQLDSLGLATNPLPTPLSSLGICGIQDARKGPCFLGGASEKERGLGKKEIMHCKEKYTCTVSLFPFSASVFPGGCTEDKKLALHHLEKN